MMSKQKKVQCTKGKKNVKCQPYFCQVSCNLGDLLLISEVTK